MTKLGRTIRNFYPVKYIRKKSKLISVPGFHGISVYTAGRFLFAEVKNDNLIDKAASIAFFFLLAIPPTFIFLFTLLPFIPLKGLENTIYGLLRDITPNRNTFMLVRNIVHDFLHTQRNGLLSFAFLLGIITSSSGVLGIMRSFNQSLPESRKRNFFQRRLTALKITTLLIILVLTCLTLILAQRLLLDYIFNLIGVKNNLILLLVQLVRWLIIVLLFFTVTSLIYTYGPALQKRWRFITIGAMLATVLFILTTLGFSYYVNHFNNYNRIYGSIGTILVLMVWVYINSLVLLIGFELNACLYQLKESNQKEIEEKIKKDSKN